MKFSTIISFIFLCVIALIFPSSIKAQTKVDTAYVTVVSTDTTSFPVGMFYSDIQPSQFVKGVKNAKGSYDFAFPIKDYAKATMMISSPYSINTKDGSFLMQPQPSFLLSPGKKMVITVNFKNQLDLKIKTDDKMSKVYEELAKKERMYNDMSWDLVKKKAATTDSALILKYENQLSEIREKLGQDKMKFLKEHAGDVAGLMVFETNYQGMPTDKASEILEGFRKNESNHPLFVYLDEKLRFAGEANVGKDVPPFQAVDRDGNAFNSKELGGKYYLIDFWGSWCAPCRASHPHLKKLYDEYHSKGLEILSIALESGTDEVQKKNWNKAIEEDGINWRHVLNTDSNNMVELFGVSSYPTKFLVAPDGKILLRLGEDSDALDKELQKIFPN